MAEVKLLPEHYQRLRYLETEEYERLLVELPGHVRPVVVMAANTGMRKEKILSLRWDQVNLAQRVIILTDTKRGDRRGVPLNSTTMELLRELMRERARRGLTSPYVFVNPLTGDRWKDVGRAFESALRRAGIENFRFHDLRHHAASWLTMAGVDLLTVASILGHKDLRMTQRYSHLSPQHKLDAVEALGKTMMRRPELSDTSKEVQR